MRQLGDKISAKLLAEAACVPVAPWSGGAVADCEAAAGAAERIGYPLVIKGSGGGGGGGAPGASASGCFPPPTSRRRCDRRAPRRMLPSATAGSSSSRRSP